MIQFEAIKAMITDPAVRVHVGRARLSVPPSLDDFPYVTVWGTLPTEHSGSGPDSPTLADLPDAWTASIRLTYAATSAASMDWLLPRVRPALNRKAPVIPGFSCERLRLRSLQPVQPDESIPLEGGRYPIYAIDELTLVAQRD